MPMEKWDACDETFDINLLRGRECYAGLDLSTTLDLTAFVLVFPPRNETEKYIIVPYFWIPEDNLKQRVRRDHVPYDIWKAQGYIRNTEGNVVDYRRIEADIKEIASEFVIKEIAYDRYNATQIILNLQDEGLIMIPFGQGYKDMSPATKEMYTLVLKNKLIHNNHPVLRWNYDNVCVEVDPAENIKPSKKHSTERIDGAVASIMALGRAVRNEGQGGSIYDTRGLLVIE
jgi:phage terminase large subunit-like protein